MGKVDATLTFQTRNRAVQLRIALESLAQGREELPIDTLVVDDATDLEWLPKKRAVVRKYTNCRMLENMRKKGIAELHNQGVMGAATRYVILADDDVIFERGFTQAVEEDIEAGFGISYYANSACFMIDKAIIPVIGWPGEERYRQWYFEDDDIGLRVRLALREGKITMGSRSQHIHVRHGHGTLAGTGSEASRLRMSGENWKTFQKLWTEGPGTNDIEGPDRKTWLCNKEEIDWHPRETMDIKEKYGSDDSA